MNAEPLYLTVGKPGRAGQSNVGRITFAKLSKGRSNAVQLTTEFRPTAAPSEGQESTDRVVSIEARTLHASPAAEPPWGRWVIDMEQTPRFDAPDQRLYWQWMLTHTDLERIENHHAVSGSHRMITFVFEVKALLMYGGELLSGSGETYVEVRRSEWEDVVLAHLGFSVPPSWSGLLPEAQRLEHPAWKAAVDRLANARRLLRRGETRTALGEVLDAFGDLGHTTL
jgi:hypothetical protein